MNTSFQVAPGITAIDTMMAGTSRLTSGYIVESFAPALVETGPATSARAVEAELDRLGIAPTDLAHILVTHIHLDHAGGVGHISEAFPSATIWVHEKGARHLADPSRLNASALRVYGQERLDALFGPLKPTAADRIRILADGASVDLGTRRLTALHTPGHASHHMAIQDSTTGVVFTGDAVGVHLPDIPVLRPACPPPEFDADLAIASIELIRQHARGSLMFAHFGPVDSVDETCELAVQRIREWVELVRLATERSADVSDIAAALRKGTAADYASLTDLDHERFEKLGGFEVNAAGLLRYWAKRRDTSP